MSQFLKKVKKLLFFSHSIGGIIPILMCKYFLKSKDIFLINYEGTSRSMILKPDKKTFLLLLMILLIINLRDS